jgi:hypothetical protein
VVLTLTVLLILIEMIDNDYSSLSKKGEFFSKGEWYNISGKDDYLE